MIHLRSESKYWQVQVPVGNPLAKAAARSPRKTELLHGRFSWEKKTRLCKDVIIEDGCWLRGECETSEEILSLPSFLLTQPARFKLLASTTRLSSLRT